MDKNLFAKLIANYATHEPKHFLQMDAHYIESGAGAGMYPDCDGDCLSIARSVELMHGATTRVLVPLYTNADVVVRQLEKISKMLRRNAAMLKPREPSPEPLPERKKIHHPLGFDYVVD